jgi:hypothetical protein
MKAAVANMLEGVFHRKKAMDNETSAAPLTCAQVNGAIETVNGLGLSRNGPTLQALNALCDVLTLEVTDIFNDREAAHVAAGDLPVTSAQVNEALTEVSEDLDGASLSILRRARDLLAEAEAQRALLSTSQPRYATEGAMAFLIFSFERAKQRPGYVDGSPEYWLGRGMAYPAAYGLSPADAACLERISTQQTAISQRHQTAERKRMESKGSGSSAGGFGGNNW